MSYWNTLKSEKTLDVNEFIHWEINQPYIVLNFKHDILEFDYCILEILGKYVEYRNSTSPLIKPCEKDMDEISDISSMISPQKLSPKSPQISPQTSPGRTNVTIKEILYCKWRIKNIDIKKFSQLNIQLENLM